MFKVANTLTVIKLTTTRGKQLFWICCLICSQQGYMKPTHCKANCTRLTRTLDWFCKQKCNGDNNYDWKYDILCLNTVLKKHCVKIASQSVYLYR